MSEQPPSHSVGGVGGIPSGEAFGSPSTHEPAREEWLIEGYLQALADFRSATQLGDNPDAPRKTFIRLFAALAFAVSLIAIVLEPPPPRDKTRKKKPVE